LLPGDVGNGMFSRWYRPNAAVHNANGIVQPSVYMLPTGKNT
jgi:hypothetical protein